MSLKKTKMTVWILNLPLYLSRKKININTNIKKIERKINRKIDTGRKRTDTEVPETTEMADQGVRCQIDFTV